MNQLHNFIGLFFFLFLQFKSPLDEDSKHPAKHILLIFCEIQSGTEEAGSFPNRVNGE